MSASLLLPYPPSSPHRKGSSADSSSTTQPLISLGSLTSYAASCHGPTKTPQGLLLKGRLHQRDSVGGGGLWETCPLRGENFFPSESSSYVKKSFCSRSPSPTRESLLPQSEASRRSSPAASPPSRVPSKSALLESPSSPPPTFPSRLPSPTTSAFSASRRPKLKKSQSTLIMPSLLTLLRPEAVPPSAGGASQQQLGSKDLTTSKSLNEFSAPSPLVRKCHTMVSLSAGGAAPSTTTTTAAAAPKDKKKPPRLGFLRRMSSSKSAVFASASSSRSPPASSSSQVLRKSPSFTHPFQRGGFGPSKTSSSSMWPHPEHPDEVLSPLPAPTPSETPTTEEGKALGGVGGGCSRCASSASVFPSSSSSRRVSTAASDTVFCKLCLVDVSIREMYQLSQCQCRFCTYCMCMYTTLKIREGEPVIECPDANCDCKGEISLEEVESLVGKELLNLHLKFRRDKEIESDPYKTWCPKPGCDTVVSLTISKLDGRPQCCSCPTCNTLFCASCSSSWHPGKPCNRVMEHLGVPFNETIKRCPRCKVPIERDAGCAQMQCKKCKHVFCWYCLTSLEDDFLLRHYDKGPCKNKLGHSRASVLWHRAQVVILFAGFGLLLVIASPLLLFVGPCLLCRTCRPCSGSSDSSNGSNNDLDERNPGI